MIPPAVGEPAAPFHFNLERLLCMASSSPALTLALSKAQIEFFFPLLQQGVEISATVGCSIQSLLCDQFGFMPEYLTERISTIFLNGKPVDDVQSAIVNDGAVLALSAAMPGLAGATLRRSGCLASFRGSITYQGDDPDSATCREGQITLKLFNLLLKEMGPLMLSRGIEIRGQVLRDFLTPQLSQAEPLLEQIRKEGRKLDPAHRRTLNWIDPDTRYHLTVTVAPDPL